MIVVIGSRHDPVASALVVAWPSASLCSADDLTRAGWRCRVGDPNATRWVVDGGVVDDRDITGVFLRRSTVHPAELLSTHPHDRDYLAAEAHAFLVFLLANTGAVVVNPVDEAGLGDETLRPERWTTAARDCGLSIAPIRLTTAAPRVRRVTPRIVEIVGDQLFGVMPERLRTPVLTVAARLGLRWATMIFDGRGRLITVTTSGGPTGAAAEALGRLLGSPAAAA